ncbi:hypothetical protein DNHGIG_00280 [Collibacillus ludicampi]|jgi:hypothetical protein|uniref:Uncharacterized protein n=2 Tax=Collibacillus ludicampi TaxID=2771369 RepID=A0AAV4L9Z9_9BACL|nr:hypothetical protein DNHGIG_00280 [Collibacillus ludicampi]
MMQFIVEYFTLTGSTQIDLKAQSYREAEIKAVQEQEKRNGVIGIKCIREIRVIQEREVC